MEKHYLQAKKKKLDTEQAQRPIKISIWKFLGNSQVREQIKKTVD